MNVLIWLMPKLGNVEEGTNGCILSAAWLRGVGYGFKLVPGMVELVIPIAEMQIGQAELAGVKVSSFDGF